MPSTEQLRILVVEDDPALLWLASSVLRTDGHAVTVAGSAEAALEAAGDWSGFDCVFTDVGLPGASGVELIAALRMVRADLPVLVTTGQAEQVRRELAAVTGCPLLAKPYAPERLRQAIRDLCELRPGSSLDVP